MAAERDALGLVGYTDGIDVSAVQRIDDAEAVRRANLAADAAELAKFDPQTGEPRR